MFYCSKCEQCFSKFRQLQKHWADHECISPDETETQQLHRPIDQLKNVWLNDNPFCDFNSDSESESESDSDDNTNIPPHHNAARSNADLQTELLHNIVLILEKNAERISPQQQLSSANPTPQQTPQQAPSHRHSYATAPPSPTWQTVRKGATPPKRHAAQSFEHPNNFSVLGNFDGEISQPQPEIHHHHHHLKSICQPASSKVK